jgi:hypothetical protein
MDSEPEFGSVVPMESCRPQWLRPVLSSDCQELDPLFEAYLSKLLAGVLASSPNVVLYSPADALCPTKGLQHGIHQLKAPRYSHGSGLLISNLTCVASAKQFATVNPVP